MLRRAGQCLTARWLILAFVASCRHSAGPGAPRACPGTPDEAAFGGIEVRRSGSKPAWVLVPRDGDPRGAVAAVVVTGGSSYASTALAALLEARLGRGGFTAVDARADRDSFRLRTLVETPERVAQFARAVQKALATPIAPGAPELALVARRLASLKRHSLEAPIAASVARCTGELGLLAGEAAPDPASSDALSAIEGFRTAAYGASRVAFGVVGTEALIDGAGEAWSSVDGWPKGSAVESFPTGDEVGAFFQPARPPGLLRLTVALSQRRADGAVEAAALAGSADGPLVARLRGLSVPFRVVEATGTVRPRGGCVAVTLESLRPVPPSGIEEAAAVAGVIARQEIDARDRGADDDANPERSLGYAGGRAVRMAGDPREAAELGALWALTAPSGEPEHAALALALAAPSSEIREGQDVSAQPQGKRFAAAVERLQKAWSAPVVERRDRTERGQGELWLLAASPCGVLAEGESDAGTTALALGAALASRGRDTRGVTLEPWIASDGVGVMAHAAKLTGESTAEQTERVAEEAARALAVFPFAPVPFASARAALLGRLGDGVSQDGKAFYALAGALVPGHPSWLAPLGAWDWLARVGAEGASLRWAALTGGPLRLAVLANESAEQGDTAARIVDRWLVRSPLARACPPAESPPSPKAGTVPVTLAATAQVAQALVGVQVPRQNAVDAVWAELTLAGLSGSDGWLAKAMGAPALAATAQARLVGSTRSAALIVDIRAPEASLEPAVQQVRALFERLRQGAIGASDFERSTAQRERWDLEASLDPRRRIVDLWRDPRPPKVPTSLEGWRTWAAAALRDDKLVVVLAKPRH